MNTELPSPWMREEAEGISLQQGNLRTLQENAVLILV